MPQHSDVLVIGGGVIGVCTAFSLRERGANVRLLERGAICSGASHGNAGWIFPSHSLPLPVPGVIRQALRWLLDPESPFYVKPRLDPELLRWLWRFRAACNAADMRETFRLNRALSLASLERYAVLAELPELDFGFTRRGILLVYRTAEALHEGREEIRLLEALGGSGKPLAPDELRERVPALAPDLAGGFYLPADAHVTPGDFVRGLAAASERRGVPIHTDTEVLAIAAAPGRAPRLSTTHGEYSADTVVLAAGAWSPELAQQLGLRVPVQSAKGYSLTLPRPDGFGDTPLMLAEARVGVTPMGEQLRFAGTLELAGLDLRVNARRLRAIARAVATFLPGLPAAEVNETWRGLRPLTPDDLPLIGRPAARPWLVLATGHGMSGVSQGPITGELVAQLVSGETPSLDLLPFSPDRF